MFVNTGLTHGAVVLNWRNDPAREFTQVARAFHAVATECVAALRKNSRFGLTAGEDYRAYPVVFLYRHALELHLKAVLLAGSRMLSVKGQSPVKLFDTHCLDKLSKDLERVFEAYGWKWDLGTPHFRTLDAFRECIREFQTIDRGSYAFRYPVNKDGSGSVESSFRFNLFKFCDILDELLPVLEDSAYLASDLLQLNDEAHQGQS